MAEQACDELLEENRGPTTLGADDRRDAALELIDRLSVSYTGAPFPMRSGVVYLIDVARSTFFELPFTDTPAA